MKFLFFLLFVRPIWGLIAMNVADSRKMKGGFWWGFFLGIVGIIVVAMRPNDNQRASNEILAKKLTANETVKNLKQYKELLDNGVLTQNEFNTIKSNLLWDGDPESGVDGWGADT